MIGIKVSRSYWFLSRRGTTNASLCLGSRIGINFSSCNVPSLLGQSASRACAHAASLQREVASIQPCNSKRLSSLRVLASTNSSGVIDHCLHHTEGGTALSICKNHADFSPIPR